MNGRTRSLSRRNFLLTVGAGSAATAAAIAAKKPLTSPLPGGSKSKRASRGYQATEHVDNYYRTTKL